MRCPILTELPPPPAGKVGWPWTQENPRLPEALPDGSPRPPVSIVTPSYNQARFLEAAIRSVLLQGYPNLAYIIIDGGSTDDSVEIIHKYEPWLAYWGSKPDRGQSAAINEGFRGATGEILAWLNSDDLLCRGAVERAASRLSRDPIVCGFRRFLHSDRRRLGTWAYPEPTAFSIRRCSYIPQETVFFRRSVYQALGELDEKLHFTMDFEYWQRAVAAGFKFSLIPRFQGIFRLHPRSKTCSGHALRERELQHIYMAYLRTSRTERELERELGYRWWIGLGVLRALARTGILENGPVADAAVRVVSSFANAGHA